MSNIIFEQKCECKLLKWKVLAGSRLSLGTILFHYEQCVTTETNNDTKAVILKYKSPLQGTVQSLVVKEGDTIQPGAELVTLQQSCSHSVVMKDLCAECGADLRELDSEKMAQVVAATSVSMIHSVPELRISEQKAKELGKADEERLLKDKKLVLLVDLDQTLIHTTNEDVPPDMKNVYHFQLYGPRSPWYHTKMRPGTEEFLKKISKLYELHIFTFGARPYAHHIACLLDTEGRFFSHRILSRDECFSQSTKLGNLKALFPCGDSMVCIIDDREDVWSFAPNLVHVKPYHFFTGTGDINAPVGAETNGNTQFPKEMKKTEAKPEEPKNEEPNTEEPKNEEPNTEEAIKTEEPKPEESIKTEQPNTEAIKTEQPNTEAIKTEEPIKTEQLNTEDIKTEQPNTLEAIKTEEPKTEDQLNNGENGTAKLEETAITEKEELKIDAAAIDSDLNLTDSTEEGEIKNEQSDEIKKPESEDSKDCPTPVDEDDYLLYLEEILTTIHRAFYDMHDQLKAKEENQMPDLKTVIPYVRRKVLHGLNIVFSGVIPTNMVPEKNKLWMIAKSLGANVGQELVTNSDGTGTTHVVAAKLGTAKVNKAQKTKGVHVISPDWLWCCAERWEHVDERLFPLSNTTVLRKPFRKHKREQFEQVTQQNVKGNQLNSPPVEACPVYDPCTGKRIRPPVVMPPVVSQNVKENFSNSYSPLLSFSTDEITKMGQEVDDACSDSNDSESDSNNKDAKLKRESETSSEDSLTGGECPKGWRKRKKGEKCAKEEDDGTDDIKTFGGVYDSEEEEGASNSKYPRRELPYDSEKSENSESDDYNQSIGSVDEEMAAAVEKEFLN